MRRFAATVFAALALPAVASAGTTFLLDGRGWGHGVGMSQWGAEGYARHGFGYERILAHYYTGTKLEVVHPKPVRVLLGAGAAKVRVGSTAPFVVVDARGKTLHLPARSVVVDRRFVLRHKHLKAPLRFRPGAQPLTYELAGYRGDIVVNRAGGGGLLAVNEAPLDRYLRGVVPREIPKGWHEAAYRAQAVAARSYALATLKPGRDYDLLPDTRSQVYGGIAAERAQTNLAVGATAGQVLTYGGRTIAAFYFSSSGGRTSSVHDAWPKAKSVPWLRSVADPYDYLSPHHLWPTQVLSAGVIGAKLGVSGVRDVVLVRNGSGRAAAVRVHGVFGWRRFGGEAIRTRFALGSTDFDIRALSLDAPSHARFGETVVLRGFLRGMGRARLQAWGANGWHVLRRVRARADGRFALSVQPRTSTRFRLAYNGVAGDAVPVLLAPTIDLRADGTKLRVRVAPDLPLAIERLVHAEWRAVAHGRGTFVHELKPGSYRVAVAGGARYLSAVSRPVGLHPS